MGRGRPLSSVEVLSSVEAALRTGRIVKSIATTTMSASYLYGDGSNLINVGANQHMTDAITADNVIATTDGTSGRKVQQANATINTAGQGLSLNAHNAELKFGAPERDRVLPIIKYDPGATAGVDDFLVISGSGPGIVLSGSTIQIAGTLEGASPLKIGGEVQLGGDSGAEFSITRYHNSATQVPKINLRKARGTEASPTIIQDGDTIGYLNFQTNDANDGSFHSVARISAKVDGTPGTDDVPASLHFITSDDGEASVGTSNTKMTIKASGRVGIGTTNPQDALHIEKSNAAASIELDRNDSDIGTSDVLGNLYFGGTENGSNYDYGATIRAVAESAWSIGSDIPTRLEFWTVPDGSSTQAKRMSLRQDASIEMYGNVLPGTTNTHNLGSPDHRWANVYTGDLHLKNERGDWTVIEESDYLSIVNNLNGKRYKFVLEELK